MDKFSSAVLQTLVITLTGLILFMCLKVTIHLSGSGFKGGDKRFPFTGWPTKMSLFFFGDNFYKNKETFKIFSTQLLEVYRILLVKTTLELTVFYYTFSVINTMFVP